MVTLHWGVQYLIKLTCQNQSRRSGVLVPATLTVGLLSGVFETSLGLKDLISPQGPNFSSPTPYEFGAGETRVITYDYLQVPDGWTGFGSITAWIADPSGNTLAVAMVEITFGI